MTAKFLLNLAIIGALLATALHAWPAFSGAEPSVRVIPADAANETNLQLMHQVETTLMQAGIDARRLVLDRSGVTVRVADAATRDSALRVLQTALGASCAVLPDAGSPAR